MSMHEYYKSINAEFEALQNRITYLIGHTHHATTGGYHESLLRSFLSKYLPENIGVGRGFIVFNQRQSPTRGNRTNDLTYNSNEMDIILYDKNRPVLYKDSSELVIVEPRSVKGIIEVKKKLSRARLSSVVEKLSHNTQKINEARNQNSNIFAGLFAYQTEVTPNEVLRTLKQYAQENREKVVNHICLGNSDFIKFWSSDPRIENHITYDCWHAYHFQEHLSIGYFIYNVLTYFTDVDTHIWFPNMSKELSLTDWICLK